MLEDWRTAPIDGKLRLTLGFLQKLTMQPAEVGPEDVAPLRTAGVRDEAILDAIAICALFSLIDRVADALGFEVPSQNDFARSASRMLKRGYGM